MDAEPAGSADLVARDLVRRVPGGRVVLAGVSATFASGAVTVVVGDNGTGKSTLARVLAGVDRPDAGTVTRPTRSAFFLPDRVPALASCSSRTVAAVLAPRLGRRVTGGDWPDRLDSALAELGFTHTADTALRRLSKGNLQKAYLAVASALAPAVMVLDEPTTGIDPSARSAAGGLIRAVAAMGSVVVVTAHEGADFADDHHRLAGGSLTPYERVDVHRVVVDLVVTAPRRELWTSGALAPGYAFAVISSSRARVRLEVPPSSLPAVLRAALDGHDSVERVVPSTEDMRSRAEGGTTAC